MISLTELFHCARRCALLLHYAIRMCKRKFSARFCEENKKEQQKTSMSDKQRKIRDFLYPLHLFFFHAEPQLQEKRECRFFEHIANIVCKTGRIVVEVRERKHFFCKKATNNDQSHVNSFFFIPLLSSLGNNFFYPTLLAQTFYITIKAKH